MKNNEVTRLYKGLEAVSNLPGAKFAYCIGRNLTLLKPVVEAIDKALKLPEKYDEYQKKYEEKRVELCKYHAKADEHGEPVTEIVTNEDGKKEKRYVITDREAFNEALDRLREEMKAEYKDTFEEMEKNWKEYKEFLECECSEELKLFKVRADNLPEDITGEQIQGIIEIID